MQHQPANCLMDADPPQTIFPIHIQCRPTENQYLYGNAWYWVLKHGKLHYLQQSLQLQYSAKCKLGQTSQARKLHVHVNTVLILGTRWTAKLLTPPQQAAVNHNHLQPPPPNPTIPPAPIHWKSGQMHLWNGNSQPKPLSCMAAKKWPSVAC